MSCSFGNVAQWIEITYVISKQPEIQDVKGL